MTKNRHCAVHCVGRQTVTVARSLKTPFLANKAEGGGREGRRSRLFTRHRHLPSVNKREDLLPQALGLTITPAAVHNNISNRPPPRVPPPHRLDARADVPSSRVRVIQSRDPGRIYALCNLTHAPRALPLCCRRVTGPSRAMAVQLTAQRRTGQVLVTHVPQLAKLARGAISSMHRRP